MPKKKRRIDRRYVIYAIVLIGAVIIGTGIGIIAGTLKNAPDLADVKFRPLATSYIYDANGKVISRLFRENRVPVTLDKIPKHLQNAIVAIEDDGFYRHHGVDIMGIARALITDALHGQWVQGGSTITQQLAKNAFLTHERTLARKLNELVWAIQIERAYTKDEILETYLNEIYFGHGAYGVEAAAQLYFGKHVSDLDLAESALLAGIPRGPGFYSPYIDMEAATRRRNIVLNRMAELGYITAEQADAAKKEPIRVVGLKPSQNQAPYFVDYVLQQLRRKYDDDQIYTGGLKIYTTLDLDMQKAAEKALLDSLPSGGVGKNNLVQPQGALVALDPRTGAIKAMVGGRGTDKFNRATQAYRQPGSAMKPFVYTAAFDRGYTAATIVDDSPVEFPQGEGQPPWRPENYDRKFRGPMTIRDAVEGSINIVAIKVLSQIGVDTAIDYARRMGITSLVDHGAANDRNLSFALGGLTKGVSPLEMAEAYAVLASGGIRSTPFAILRVEDANGNVLEENQPSRSIVLSEQTAYLMTDVLRGVVERGTGKAANIGRPAAGKTGTTDDNTNAWFVGYTPDLVAAVWMGDDDQSKQLVYRGVRYGSWFTASIWGKFMKEALRNTPPSDFSVPDGMSTAIIDTKSGLLATTACTSTRQEIFIKGTEPTQYCNLHGWGEPLAPSGDAVPPGSTPDEGNPSTVAPGSNTGGTPSANPPDEGSLPATEATAGSPPTTTSPAANGSTTNGATPNGATRKPPRSSAALIELEVCTESNALATANCPRDKVELRWYRKDTNQEVDRSGRPIPGSFAPVTYCTSHG